MKTVVILSISFLLFAVSMHFVYADIGMGQIVVGKPIEPKHTYISIYLSDSCERSTSCPDYKNLADTFDTSNRYLSGDFKQDANGKWYREKPITPKALNYYLNSPLTIFVNPDSYTARYSKIITIEPSIPVYIDHSSMKIKLNNTSGSFERISYSGFWIKKDCKEGVVGWKQNGTAVLADMVNYFYKSCDGSFPHDPTQKTYTPKTIFTDCGKWCEYTKWLLNAKDRSKETNLIAKE